MRNAILILILLAIIGLGAVVYCGVGDIISAIEDNPVHVELSQYYDVTVQPGGNIIINEKGD